MYVVAIGSLSGTIDDTIRPLADELGTTAYELRLVLNAGLPAVVLVTVDENIARAAIHSIERHGHSPVLCDRRDVVSRDQMTLIREPRFDADALVAGPDTRQALAYADIDVLLRAAHRSAHESTQTITERKLRPVMAIATGGLVLTKTAQRSVTSTSVSLENVLYVFRRGSLHPWLLRERHALYNHLGPDLSPTSLANFTTVIAQLRSRTPHAPYDERLVTSRPIRGLAEGIDATDVYAHLLAQHLRGASK
jgi:hypothetical protein